jgi:hypothetical protein
MQGGLTFTNVAITFRYDDVAASGIESLLKVFYRDNITGAWVDSTSSLDLTNKWITTLALPSSVFSSGPVMFAVTTAVPEPGSLVSAAGLAMSALLLRRRRQQAQRLTAGLSCAQ